jgi:hypothetical protein
VRAIGDFSRAEDGPEKNPKNRRAPRDPALPSRHDCIVIASLRSSNPVFVVFAPSDLQLHIFARLVIGRTLALPVSTQMGAYGSFTNAAKASA